MTTKLTLNGVTTTVDASVQKNAARAEPALARRNLVAVLMGAAGAGAAASVLSACLAPESTQAGGSEKTDEALEQLTTAAMYFPSVGVRGGAVGGTLRATIGSSTSAVAVLEGFATPGDGGGGVFYWSTTGTDDGGTSFGASASDAGAPTGYWIRIYSGPISVKWFGATGTGADDTNAIKAAYLAAVAKGSATVYFPAGSYSISSTITIGDGVSNGFTSINTIGEGSVSTSIVWVGPTNQASPTDTALLYWRNKYSRMSGLSVRNGTGTTGTTIGTLLTGPASGSQSNGLVFENCSWSGFGTGLQAGGGALGTEAASEVAFINCAFISCTNGFVGAGSGNTLSLWFYGCAFSGNTQYGASLGSSGSVHFWGGGSVSNGVAVIAPAGAWQGALRLEGFRCELTPPEVFTTMSAVPLVVENCVFLTTAAVPTYAIIRSFGNTIIRGCTFGNGGDTGWIPYDPGGGSIEMTGNTINGTVPLYINPVNSQSNGVLYSLFGNTYGGVVHGSEIGSIVWPNRVNDTIDGIATFAGAASCPVTFTTRENATYKVTLSGNSNETFWVTSKSTTGFTLHSSVTSTASVDWVVSR